MIQNLLQPAYSTDTHVTPYILCVAEHCIQGVGYHNLRRNAQETYDTSTDAARQDSRQLLSSIDYVGMT